MFFFFPTWWSSCPCPSLFVILLLWKLSKRNLNSMNQISKIVFDQAGHRGQTQLTNSAKSAHLKASFSISQTYSLRLWIGKSHTGGAVQAALTCLLFLFPLQNALKLTSNVALPVLSCISLNQCHFWTVAGEFLLPSFLSLPFMESRRRASSYALPEQSCTTKDKWRQTVSQLLLQSAIIYFYVLSLSPCLHWQGYVTKHTLFLYVWSCSVQMNHLLPSVSA